MPSRIDEIMGHYVDELVAQGAITSPPVAAAFRTVKRHLLVERLQAGPDRWLEVDPASREHLEMVYSDQALVTRPYPNPSSTSQPTLVAAMLEALHLQPGMRVLEIGTGTGYNAALIAELAGNPALVTTVEVQGDVAEQAKRLLAMQGYGAIHTLTRDGFFGAAEHGPYDRIVATAACMDLSPYWSEQLAPDGSMLIPLAHGDRCSTPLVCVEREAQCLRGRVLMYCGFMPLRGELGFSAWLTEKEEAGLLNTAAQGERHPDAALPLPEGLRDLASPMLPPSCWSGNWPARLEFYYFLALSSRSTFHVGTGIGLARDGSAVLVTDEAIELFGPGARDLCGALLLAYREWQTLGRPLMAGYELELWPIARTTWSQPLPPRTWAIERRYYRQLLRLL